MVAQLFYITRTEQGVNNDRNLVRECIINNDSAETNAQHIQEAVDQLNLLNPTETKGGDADAEKAYPNLYFDTVSQIGATPVGVLATDHDIIAFPPSVASKKT